MYTYINMAYSRILSHCLISCLLLFNTIKSRSLQNHHHHPTTINNNVIDSCLLSKPNWASNRRALADCAVGFGSNSVGGKNGRIYVVTINPNSSSSSSDDPENPKPGTLRYALIQNTPLWITFAGDMVISLKTRLIVNSYKTIDGRGARVEINGDGGCIHVNRATHVIVHGIILRGCKSMGRLGIGDGITVFGSSHVWIDHCSISDCADGLIDVIRGSTGVTISNNYFFNQDKVMLLGNDDINEEDDNMRVTIVFNYFGPGLVQRMPRVRRGYAHVANNMYEKWRDYAVGGSGNPTIFSEGNYYTASELPFAKEVTRRLLSGGGRGDGEGEEGWRNWTWKSSRDVFRNGAFFTESGTGTNYLPKYSSSQAFTVAHGNAVPALTSAAGPLKLI